MVYIALLRAINVGGRNQIAMSDLRDLLTALGFSNPKTLLQSGNLVFEGKKQTAADLEGLLEVETAKRLKVHTNYLVRTSSEWKQVVTANPFQVEARNDPGHLLVVFLRKAPPAEAVAAIQNAIRGPENVRVDGRHAYITYPAGIGRSKLTITLIEKKLGSPGTGRNWNTVLKLLELAQA
jgi:uncharacterized protein (DUF1697 family)